MLIIGSRALSRITGESKEISGDEVWDWDLICTWAEFEGIRESKFFGFHDHLQFRGNFFCNPTDRGKKWVAVKPHAIPEYRMIVEAEIAWKGSVAEQILLATGSHPSQIPEEDPDADMFYWDHDKKYADLNTLYALKMSHRFLKDSPHFHKTRADVFAMRDMGATIDGCSWYKDRVDETYWYEHPNLDRSKDEFFGADAENYAYDHDDLHRVVAVVDQTPAYLSYLKDGSDVLCDRSKWHQLAHQAKLCGVYEEASVLALERSIIPFGTDPDEAFRFALMKTVTSITSGWFREFGWEGFDSVIELHQKLGVSRIRERVEVADLKVAHPGALNTIKPNNV